MNKAKQTQETGAIFTPHTPPTLEEITAHCREKGYVISPEYFYEYHEALGWRDANGMPIINWKWRLLTWNTKAVNARKAET